MEQNENKGDTAHSRYEVLKVEREGFLKRAREASKLTLPSLIPPEGVTGTSDLYKPFQSVGASGVRNLSSKLLMSLFPPNTPPFRFKFDDMKLEKLAQANENFKSEFDEALAKGEQIVQNEIETSQIRPDVFEIMKHLIVGGNTLVHKPKKRGEKTRVYPLEQYVVSRDFSGQPHEIILLEKVSPNSLPERYRKLLDKNEDGSPVKSISLYTHLKLVGKSWNIHQEVAGSIIMETIGSYPKDKCPWLPLRWSKIQGENYGRGFIEEHYGDLQSLEGLMKAIVQGSAAAAKVLFLVNPNGTTSIKDIAETVNGGFCEGRKEDITTLQLEKFNDFRVVLETIDRIEQRLSRSFLLNSSIQRNGERVTAEEIRYLAGELETTLGGVYAVLSQEFQLPFINILIDDLQSKGKLPKLPTGSLKPTIITGLEALGRNNDLTKLDQFLKEIGQLLNPTIEKYINVDELFKRRATAIGLDIKGLVRTKEEIQNEAQQQQQQQALATLGPQLVNQGGKLLANQAAPEVA